MNREPYIDDRKLRTIVILVLFLLLVLFVFLTVREVRFLNQEPLVTEMTPSLAEISAAPTDNSFQGIDSALANLPTETPVPTEVPTPEPPPTEVPTATPKPTQARTMRRGDKGDDVLSLQKRLIELHYLKDGSADGSFGKGTKAALQEFQKKNGLAPDGVAGQETVTRLFRQDAQ